MARPLRINVRDGWYHVTARGTERRVIFPDESCHRHFLELLEEMTERHRVKLHAYVLMPNHYHLVLSTPDANLSAAMQWLKTSYSMWFNRRRGRVGPLFQGRFKAELFEGRTQAWPITRYVHLNPVRVKALELNKTARRREGAGAVAAPAELVKRRKAELRSYPWSSYAYYAGYRAAPEWLSVNEVLGGERNKEDGGQTRAYREYVEGLLGASGWDSPMKEAEGGVLLGSAGWVQRMKKRLKGDGREQPAYRALRPRPNWEGVRRAIERVRGEAWLDFADRHGDWGRDMALHVLRMQGGLTLREAAQCVGIAHYQTAAQALRRFAQRMRRDETLRTKLEALTNCM